MIEVICRKCGFSGMVQLRKHIRIEGKIQHIVTEKDVPYTFKEEASSEKFAAVTGVPCPKCKKYKLRRVA